MLDDKKKDLHGFEKPNLSLEPTLSDPIDNPISDPLNGPLHNSSATATATPEADTETTLIANKEFSVSEKSLIIATLVISIIFFFIFLDHAASENTTFGNKKSDWRVNYLHNHIIHRCRSFAFDFHSKEMVQHNLQSINSDGYIVFADVLPLNPFLCPIIF